MKSRIRQSRAKPAAAKENRGTGTISVAGAHANNLRKVNCSLDRHQMVCVCGVSGSGKSSLLFSVLAAESQARHEALLSNPRRKNKVARAQADAVTGLPYCFTVSQRTLHVQKRSTVATQTGIHHDWSSLVYQFGRIRCECGREVGPPASADLLAAVRHARQKTLRVSAVVFRHGVGGTVAAIRKGDKALKQLWEGGEWLAASSRGSFDVVLACALELGEFGALEIEEALATAAASQAIGILFQGVGKFSKWTLDTTSQWPCPKCGVIHPRANASLLSFNSAPERSGRCAACAGTGTALTVDLNRIIIAPERPLLDGALGLERRTGSFRHISLREDTIRGVIRGLGGSEASAWRRLPKTIQEAVLHGTAKREQPLHVNGKKSGAKVLYHGLLSALTRLAEKPGEAGDYARTFVAECPCQQCGGRRYDPERVGQYEYHGKSFLDFLNMATRDASAFLGGIAAKQTPTTLEYAVLGQCLPKLDALQLAGLGHLDLGRGTSTLSGGELQRLKISRSLAGGLSGSCFILDEPSLGLHAADNEGMIRNLRSLRDAGNTVILADHDPDFIDAADTRISLGPGGGHKGGRILSQDVPAPAPMRSPLPTISAPSLVTVHGCSLHNIRGTTISVPLGRLVCLTGVSGSGKSTFARGILVPALKAALAHGRQSGPAWTDISGAEKVSAVLAVEQTALSRSKRSLVATFMDIAEPIRELLAGTELARQREYRPAMFSSNRPEGRCPACSGLGVFEDEDNSDTTAAPVCDACLGSRFRDAILDCRWQQKNIAEILNMEIADAVGFFAEEREIGRRLALLGALGLGHLKLGRPTAQLSGGEAQRLKLAAGIADSGEDAPAGLLFILDEPTAGLHSRDVQALLALVDQLLAGGRNTVVVIEHDLNIIRVCDHVIDFGPGSADEGGRVVAQGSPAEIIKIEDSRTGAALRRSLEKGQAVVSTTASSTPNAGPPSMEEATRFYGFLQQHYAYDPMGDVERDEGQIRAAIRPTYLLQDDFPSHRETVLDALRFSNVLDEILRPTLNYQPESDDAVWTTDEALSAVAERHCVLGVKLAWSLTSDIASEGRATRSMLPMLLKHAKETGARYWTDQTGAVHAISHDDFRLSDPFHVRVIAEGPADAAGLGRALQLGSGWACALGNVENGKCQVLTHFINRPLSVMRRTLAGRALLTGFGQKRGSTACPFCGGSGEMKRCEEALICAAPHRSPTEGTFLTPGAQALLQPVAGRLKKNLEFLQTEGITDLVAARKRWTTHGALLLWFGYPWARFPIPGKSSQKLVDFYEWRGFYSLILDRLHLSKDHRWRSAIEASIAVQSCGFCKSSGLNWSAQHTLVQTKPLLDFLQSLTFQSLTELVASIVSSHNALLRCIKNACEVGLGRVRVMALCTHLSPEERRLVRQLALQHVGLAEAGYLLPESDRGAFDNPHHKLRLAFS